MAVNRWITSGTPSEELPSIHVVSDSLGLTGQAIARAAASNFGSSDPYLETLPGISNPTMLERELEDHFAYHEETAPEKPFVIFYTVIDPDLHQVVENFITRHERVWGCDMMSGPVSALREATGLEPSLRVGGLYEVDDKYFKRIEAMEFTIDHDDGRNPQDLTKADIVLLGVSRSSKTPLSIYLSQQGYKVSNVPLDYQSEPPKEIYDVDPTRLFGLVISAETLADIRKRRIGKAAHIAPHYADLEYVYKDLEDARALMRRLGAIIVRTDNRAIEETAQEILRYYDSAHPL